MQDLLSQDEIDALLHGVDDGDIDTYEETDDTGVKQYDLPVRTGLFVAVCPRSR
jgi:flagellar motor switch protein FliM